MSEKQIGDFRCLWETYKQISKWPQGRSSNHKQYSQQDIMLLNLDGSFLRTIYNGFSLKVCYNLCIINTKIIDIQFCTELDFYCLWLLTNKHGYLKVLQERTPSKVTPLSSCHGGVEYIYPHTSDRNTCM